MITPFLHLKSHSLQPICFSQQNKGSGVIVHILPLNVLCVIHFSDIPQWQTQICFGYIHLTNHRKCKRRHPPHHLLARDAKHSSTRLASVVLRKLSLRSVPCHQVSGYHSWFFASRAAWAPSLSPDRPVNIWGQPILSPRHLLLPRTLLGHHGVSKYASCSMFLLQGKV